MAKRPQARQKPIHSHDTVQYDADEGARPITMDARSLTLPSMAIIAVVLSSMSLTYFLTQERSRIDNRIDVVITSVERLSVSIAQLADGIRLANTDRFTSIHHQLWCSRAENMNKGFKCPQTPTQVASPATSSLNHALGNVSDEMDAIAKKVQGVK